MDPIAVAPVTPPAPVNDSQTPRESRQEEGSKESGFDKALKKELSLLLPDTAVADPAAELAEDALATDALVDPALAGLITDPALQSQNAAALAAAAAAAANAAGREIDDRFEQTGSDTAAIDTAIAAERGLTERGANERFAAERNASHRVLSDREMKQRIAGDVMDAKLAREAEEGELSAAQFAVDLPKDSLMPAVGVGPERAALATVAGQLGQSVAGAGLPGDSVSSLSLLSKWTGGAPGLTEAAPAHATARIDTPLGTPGWQDAFQQKILFLVDRQQQSAELHINPPHLGPVDIMLNLTNDSASLAFVSPHAAVREAIEAGLQDLQTALNQRGMEMGETMVSADSGSAREQFAQNAAQADSSANRDGGSRPGRGGPPSGALAIDAPRQVVATRGLVDIFA